MLKGTLIFSVASFILFAFVSSDEQSLPPYREKPIMRQLYVDLLNDARYEYSIGLKIANMQKLSYDIELELELKSFFRCSDIRHGSNYRVVYLRNITTSTRVLPDLPKSDGRDVSSLIDLFDVEILHALQSRVACVTVRGMCPLPRHLWITAGTVCLFGPKSSEPMPGWIKGKPMSQCPNGKTDSGLCKSDLD